MNKLQQSHDKKHELKESTISFK